MIEIPRDLFYQVMAQSPNLSYVEEIEGFRNSKKAVNLFEVMKRLDVYDIFMLMVAMGLHDVAFFVRQMWLDEEDDRVTSFEGFDCYLPPEFRRDALIKRFIRDRNLDSMFEFLKGYGAAAEAYWAKLA